MRGGIVLWSLMASAPVLLLGVMGIVGRTQISTWEFESYSPKENLALLAYQKPLEAALALQAVAPDDPTYNSRLKSAVDIWLDGHRKGELVDIYPGSMEDQGSSGIKGQITEIRQILINNLHFSASSMASEERHFDFCRAQAEIVLLADIGKYSGISTIQQGSLVQTGALHRMATRWNRLTPAEKDKLRKMLASARRTDEPINSLAERLSHLAIRRKMIFNDSLKDMGSVFHASHLASLVPPPGVKLSELKNQSRLVGLDPVVGVTLAASLKSEEKFKLVLDILLNPASDPSDQELLSQGLLQN